MASAILSIKVLSDSARAAKDMDRMSGRMGKIQSAAEKAKPAARAIGVGLVAVGAFAAKSASDLQQAQGAVESVFGKSSAAVAKYASTSANRLGVAKAEYLNSAALMGSALQNAGFKASQAAKMTDQAFSRSADLAATFGGSAADAMDAINAAVSRGEFDPLEKYAVSLNATAVNAELAKRGQDKLSGSALKNAKAQVVLDSIYAQTAKTQGQFAREADTAAGAQQRAKAALTDAAAEIGTALLPAVAKAATAFASFAKWVAENKRLVGVLAGILATFVGTVYAVSGATKAYNAAMTVANVVQKAWNSTALLSLRVKAIDAMAWVRSTAAKVADTLATTANTIATKAAAAATKAWTLVMSAGTFAKAAAGIVATTAATVASTVASKAAAAASKAWAVAQGALNVVMSMNPIALIVIAVIALVAAFVIAYKKSETFRNIVNAAFAGIMNVVRPVINWLRVFIPQAFAFVVKAVRTYVRVYMTVVRVAFNVVRSVVTTVINVVKRVVTVAWRVISTVVRGYVNAYKAVIVGGFNLVKRIVSAAMRVVRTVISSGWNAVKSVTNGAWNGIRSGVSRGINSIVNLARSIKGKITGAVRGLWGGLTSGLSGVVNGIRSTLGSIIGVVNKAIGAFNKLPGPDIPKISGFAKGVRNFRGGLALVGEEGPEFVRLPRGSDVYSNTESRAMARSLDGGAGDGQTVIVQLVIDGKIVEEKVAKVVGRQARRVAMGGAA